MIEDQQQPVIAPPGAKAANLALLLAVLLAVVTGVAVVRELTWRSELASLKDELASQVAAAGRDASMCQAELAAVRALGPPTVLEEAGWSRPAVGRNSDAGLVAAKILSRDAVGVDACARSFEAEALIRETAQ